MEEYVLKFFYSESEIDHIIAEDANSFDITSNALKIGGEGSLSFMPKEQSVVLSSLVLAKSIGKKFDLDVSTYKKNGDTCSKGDIFISFDGECRDLHKIWKIVQNLFERSFSISTYTKMMVEKSSVPIYTNRKAPINSKKIAQEAVINGGGFIHRSNLSDSILIFEEHLIYTHSSLEDTIKSIREEYKEHNISIECSTKESATRFAKLDIDILQLDNFTQEELGELIESIKKINSNIKTSAAGGINLENIENISSCGVDFIITSAPYNQKPIDIKGVFTRDDE